MDINYEEVFDITEEKPAEQPTEPQEEAQQAEEPAKPEEESAGKPEQSPEERARQAAGRRIREREEAARQAERERISATIKRLGIKDPTTDKPIETLDELEAYEKGLSDERIERGNANKDDLRRVIQEELSARQAPPPPETKQPDPRIQAELDEIKRLDPEATDLKAIMAGPYGAKFVDYVQNKKLSFIEAYKLAAGDKLDKLRSGQAEQAARVKAASKDHLSATGTRGAGAVSVPSDEMAYYKLLMPDASEAEIQKHYAADQKRFGPK